MGDCLRCRAVVRREDQEEIGAKMIFVFFSFVFAATHAFPAGPLNFNPSMVHQDGPLNMDALNMLHADAVKFGSGAKENKWFAAVDAGTLDNLITQMNTMNRWFAKVVKYWDDFTSGGDGAKILAEQGKGIDVDEPVDGGSGGSEGSADGADGATDEQDADADAADSSEQGDDTEPADNEGEEPAEGKEGGDGETPAEGEEGGDGETPAEGEEGTDGEKTEEGEEGGDEEKPAEGDEGADKEDPAEGEEGGDTETGADDGATEGGDDADGGDTEAKGKDADDAATRKRMKKRRMKKRF